MPIDNISKNIKPEFFEHWKKSTDISIDYIFDYMMFISNSEWYKIKKSSLKRFYFCLFYI